MKDDYPFERNESHDLPDTELNRYSEDDDDRTVADMSQVYSRSVFLPRTRKMEERAEAKRRENTAQGVPLDTRQTATFIGGALTASLLIVLAFIVGLGLVILLLWLAFR